MWTSCDIRIIASHLHPRASNWLRKTEKQICIVDLSINSTHVHQLFAPLTFVKCPFDVQSRLLSFTGDPTSSAKGITESGSVYHRNQARHVNIDMPEKRRVAFAYLT
jgi:hypothetical protein